MTKSCFAALLMPFALSACMQAPAGDFCDIAQPDVYASDEVVEFLVQNDPDHVRADLAENEYGRENCPASWWAGR